jgi:hypothetical protein
VARSKHSGKGRGSKRPTAAPRDIERARARQRHAEPGRLLWQKIVIAAAAIVVLGGLAFLLLTDG